MSVAQFAFSAALYLAGVGAAGQISKVATLLDARFLSAGYSLSEATGLLTTISVASAVLGLAAGTAAAAFGIRRAFLACAFLSLGAGWALSLPLEPDALLAVRVVESVGHLGLVTTVPALMLAYLPVHVHERALAFWSTFFGAAFALSALGFLLLGAENALLLERLHLALFLPGVAVVIAFPPPGEPSRMPRSISAALAPVRRIGPAAWLLAAMFLVHAGLFTTVLSMAPRMMSLDLAVAEEHAIRAAPLFPLVALASAAAASLAGPRLARHRLEAGLCAILIGFVGAYVVATSAVPLAFCVAFAGLGMVQAHIFGSVSLTASSGEDISVANGLLAMLGNIGNIAIPFMIALLFDATGQHWLGIAAAVCGALVWLVSRRFEAERRLRHAL
ncbi:MFS transporter [Salinarimonas ramus]|uniref:Major Facilitator Superfamily protein n=1 Tax=Salinarimonas ramus TaxID=690164 RepID=A0A917V2A6_9HYPH|nr:MFS transporter [Salinarimonas ramus]GGK22274.1 hypothetical protein GCM10011322_06180 [Salinarimonas ramus]